MAFDVHNFQEDVIRASATTPIIVDFWAPWCGPCRVLGPVLEKLDAEAGDSWTLVKVNSDTHQDLAVEYGIRGIPAVKMFWKGEIVGEFTGALPEEQIRKWLQETLPIPSDSMRSRIEIALKGCATSGDCSDAISLLESALSQNPEDLFYLTELAKLIVWKEPNRALDLINTIETFDPLLILQKDSISAIAQIHSSTVSSMGLLDSPVKNQYVSALEHVVAGQLGDALVEFIEVIKVDRYYDDDGSRKACVAIFTLLGAGHELTKKYRRTFDMVLY